MRCLASLALALLALGAALALTPASTPPGQAAVCPELSSSSSEESCVHACVTDQNCPQGTKCCARSPCGRSCMVPFIVPVPKAGRCPQVQALQTPGPCVESGECSRDDQCDGGKKCCFSRCAMRCLDPAVGPLQ